MPACFAPWKGAQPLSYHADQTRWGKAPEPDRCLLQTVAKGQEFVIDCERNPEALLWAGKTIGQGMDFKPSKTLAFAPKKSAKI